MSFPKSPFQNIRLNKFWFRLMCVFIIILFFISAAAYLRLIPTFIARFPYYDTVGHFMLFGIAGYIAQRAFDRSCMHILNFQIPFGPTCIACFATLEEVLQILSPNRTVSLSDLGAGIAGIVFFYLIDVLIQKNAKTTPKDQK